MCSAEGNGRLTIHATLVARGAGGVLLRGPSGAGKSDLALRLIAQVREPRWQLISDDRVALSLAGGKLVGRAPATIAGKLEVRGVGIVSVDTRESAEIALAVDLVARRDVPRLPEPDTTHAIAGTSLPVFRLHSFDASTPDKVALLLERILARGLRTF